MDFDDILGFVDFVFVFFEFLNKKVYLEWRIGFSGYVMIYFVCIVIWFRLNVDIEI